MLVSLVGMLGGCLHDPTIGPVFIEAPAARPGSARVYLYRVDPHHSYSTAEVRFDNAEPLQILDEEYIPLELTEGTHEVAFRLGRRLGWPNGAWRSQRIRATAGETLYFEINVGVTERPLPGSPDLEIAGRNTSGTAGEMITMQARTASEALPKLEFTHQHVP